MSSHGWRVWTNESLISFDQNGEPYCIPEGFEPVGELEKTATSAVFPDGASGVFIHSSDFASMDIELTDMPFKVRVLYLQSMQKEQIDEYVTIIERAFHDINDVYPKTKVEALIPHAVLITVGVAGDGKDFETSVYPNPSERMSIVVRNLEHKRVEELYIHAIAHLYNRYRTAFLAYEALQAPVPAEDWQEMEASWTEVAFRSSSDGRIRRLSELYDVHEAVSKNAFSESLIYPFSIREIFENITKKTVILGTDSTYNNYQYGHYVLAPLVMVGIEGMLRAKGHTDIQTLIKEVHRGEGTSFFVLLKSELSDSELDEIQKWIQGEKMIPRELIFSGAKQYEYPYNDDKATF